jgi:hypothetical protein
MSAHPWTGTSAPTSGTPASPWTPLRRISVNPPSGDGRSRATLPEGPRQETAVVALGDEIVVVGGFDENAAFGAVVEAYRPSDDRWRPARRRTGAPPPRQRRGRPRPALRARLLGHGLST